MTPVSSIVGSNLSSRKFRDCTAVTYSATCAASNRHISRTYRSTRSRSAAASASVSRPSGSSRDLRYWYCSSGVSSTESMISWWDPAPCDSNAVAAFAGSSSTSCLEFALTTSRTCCI